jgi:hypothetical protein
VAAYLVRKGLHRPEPTWSLEAKIYAKVAANHSARANPIIGELSFGAEMGRSARGLPASGGAWGATKDCLEWKRRDSRLCPGFSSGVSNIVTRSGTHHDSAAAAIIEATIISWRQIA